ncbi:MAG: guanine deaminase, partial [Mesorhizobium sp.]
MTAKILRGRTLSFMRWPETIDDHSAWRYEEDGALLIDNGRIVAAGVYADVKEKADAGVGTIDHRPH